MSISNLLQTNDFVQRNNAKLAVSKWEKTGLLEGLKTESEKAGMAQLLENQARQLVKEASSTGVAAGSEEWAGVALPLVRRIFAEFAAKEFVSVQPMNLPSGLIFYLDFKYGTAQPGFDNDNLNRTGDPFGSTNADDSMFGVTTTSSDPSGGLYGAGRFAYSINQFSASATVTAATASWSQVEFSAELSASIAANQFTSITVTTPSTIGRVPDFKGVRAFVLGSGSVTFPLATTNARLLPQFTTTNGTTITFIYSGSMSGTNTVAPLPSTGSLGATLFYNVQPTDNARGEFEDRLNGGFANAESSAADNLAIPEINIQMKSEAIVAKTRKLKAQWTPEFAQDLNAYQSLDAEAELTSIMSEYIALEIDLENLDMLIQDASAADEYWSAKNNNSLNAAKTAWDTTNVFYNTQGEWFQTLGTKFQKVSNKIHQKTLRGGANFLVCSPNVATIIESIPGFASSSDGDVTKGSYAFGIQKAGQFNSRYTVYKNPYMTENVILMGYRGAQFLETGAVFAPYVPLIMTPLVYDPVTFTPRKGLLTRYAKKMIRPEFFGRVFVNDLASV